MCGINSGNKHVPLGSRVSGAAEDVQAKNLAKAALGVGSVATAVALGGVGAAALASMQAIPVTAAGVGSIVGAAIGGIMAGMAIQLPGNVPYTIKSGDTLGDIAKKALGDKATDAEIDAFVDKIVNLNADIIKNENVIYTGDTIAIPAKGTKAGKAQANKSFVDE